MSYAKRQKTKFTFQSFDVLKVPGTDNLYELESFFLSDFLTNFGCFPICNNQSGFNILSPLIDPRRVTILWEKFS